MKKVCVLLALLITNITYAGLGDTLRELRGSVREMAGTAREAGDLSKEVGVTTGTSTNSTSSATEIKSGDTVITKVAKVKVYLLPDKKSTKLLQLAKSDEVIYMGEEQNGMYKINTPEGEEGWVDKLLVKKQ